MMRCTLLILFFLGAAVPAGLTYPRCVPVLLYHDVSDKVKRPYYTGTRKFSREMNWLSKHGFTTIDENTLIRFMKKEKPPLPEHPVVIQFDDGKISQRLNAVPVLKAKGYTASFFIFPAILGRNPIHMTWEDLTGLKEEGFRIESHSWSHANLTRLRGSQLTSQLTKSAGILRKKLNLPVSFFALPYGATNRKVSAKLRQSDYSGVFTSYSGCNRPGESVFRIRRYSLKNRSDFRRLMVKIEREMNS